MHLSFNLPYIENMSMKKRRDINISRIGGSDWIICRTILKKKYWITYKKSTSKTIHYNLYQKYVLNKDLFAKQAALNKLEKRWYDNTEKVISKKKIALKNINLLQKSIKS